MKRTVMVGLFLVCVGNAWARDLEEILKDKGVLTDREAAEAAKDKGGGASPLPALPEWVSKITLFGDVRLRNETFFRENDPDRIRQRFRLRFGARVKVNDETDLGFKLASGAKDDLISNNQTFTEAFSFKNVAITNAYLKVAPAGSFGWSRPYVTLMGGKFDIPLYDAPAPAGLVYDRDLTPEGFFETLRAVESKDGVLRSLSMNLGQWIFQENSKTGEGALYAFQGVANLALGEGVTATLAAGDYKLQKASTVATARNRNPSVVVTNNVRLSDGTLIGGRVVDPTREGPNRDGLDATGKPITITGLVSDFNEVNAGGDLAVATGVAKLPLRFFGNWVLNTDAAGSDDMGFTGGATVGRAQDPCDVFFTYAYERLETDAALSAFVESDFGPDGGTNTKGHILQAGYVLLKNLALQSTTYITKPVDEVAGRNPKTSYRWQVDLVGKF